MGERQKTLLRDQIACNHDARQRVPLIGKLRGDNKSVAVTSTRNKIPINDRGTHLVVL